MKLTIMVRYDGEWMEVHKTGCRDILRNLYSDAHNGQWVENHDSLSSCAESVASDFIAEGSMTIDDALSAIKFYPCVTLPE